MKAFLILEDGTVFEGSCIGSEREVISEIVFNTSMTGYLEVLSDPSYAGQAVVMTYPLIGNYGISYEDMESSKPWPDGYIVRELSRIPSNFRSEDILQHFLVSNDIPGISGIDTRALTKILREKGTMNGMITTRVYENLEEVVKRIKAYKVAGVVERTSCKEISVMDPGDMEEEGWLVPNAGVETERCTMASADGRQEGQSASNSGIEVERCAVSSADGNPEGRSVLNAGAAQEAEAAGGCMSPIKRGKRVALLDLGAKRNIARSLVKRGCQVTIYPCHTSAEEILASHPDGIMLSNGPGDPKENIGIIKEVRKLYESSIPIFAICLGHQLMALATGADTYKLKYGHRGGNHPVKDLETGRVYISSQNHGYAVDEASLNPRIAVPAFVNVNDGTNEGLRYIGKPVFTVQYHPEACPGPQDSGYLFDRFLEMMEVNG